LANEIGHLFVREPESRAIGTYHTILALPLLLGQAVFGLADFKSKKSEIKPLAQQRIRGFSKEICRTA
jgi:hypothetical protein